MSTRKPKTTPTQHKAQAPIRKAKRAANQRKADARLRRLLDVCGLRISFLDECWPSAFPPSKSIKLAHKEYRFDPPRKWAFDCAFPAEKIAIEIDGGQWQITGRDQTREAERSNAAALGGWLVLHFTSAMIDTDVAGCAELLRQAFVMREKVEPPKVIDAGNSTTFLQSLRGAIQESKAFNEVAQQTPISGSAAISTRRHHQ